MIFSEMVTSPASPLLVLNPLLAPQFVYEHKDNTAICLQEDGSYLITEYNDEM